jgi:hypothetical protein
LTNIETKPKKTIKPERTAMASVNGEISPGKTVIPVIQNECEWVLERGERKTLESFQV